MPGGFKQSSDRVDADRIGRMGGPELASGVGSACVGILAQYLVDRPEQE